MNAVESVWDGLPVQAIRSRNGTTASVELRGIDGQVQVVDFHVDPRTSAVDPERDPTPLLGPSARDLPRLYAAVQAFWAATGPVLTPEPLSRGPAHPSLLGLRAVGALTYEVTLADGMPTVRVDVDALGRVRYNYPEPSVDVDLVRIGSAVRAFHLARQPAPRDGKVGPVQARSVIEASAYIELALVERKGDIDFELEVTVRSIGSGECYVRFHGEYSGQPLDLPVLVTSGDENAPSRLLDAGQWLALQQRYAEQADELLTGLNGGEPDDAAYESIAHELARAQVAGAEAARFLPDDAGTVPAAAVWSALGRAQREWIPHSFDRAGIEAMTTENERRIDEFIDRHGAAHLERRSGTSRRYAARSVPEAQLWAQLDTCECGGLGVGWEVVEVGSVRDGLNRIEMESACAQCGRVRRLTFAVPVGTERLGPYDFAYPDDGPSTLYDAAEWWAMAQEFAQVADRMIAEATDDAWTSGRAWDEVVRYLWHAVTALDEVLRFAPDGAAELPTAAIWTPWGEQARQASPDRFRRTSLEAERATRLARVETFLDRHPEPAVPDDGELDTGSGSGDDDWPVGEEELRAPVGPATRYPLARSEIEQRVFLMMHPCACGEPEFDPKQGAARTDDGAWVTWFRGRCPACGELREFVFRPPDRMVLPPPHAWAVGPEPSQLLDPGEWAELIQKLLGSHQSDLDRRSPRERADARSDLLFAASAVEEILKFIPEGADAVPESAFWTVEGRSRWDRHPDMFRRDSLEASREYCLSRADAIDDVGGAP